MFFFKSRKIENLFLEKFEKLYDIELELIDIAEKRIRMLRAGDVDSLFDEFVNKRDIFDKLYDELKDANNSGVRIKKNKNKAIIKNKLEILNKNAIELSENRKSLKYLTGICILIDSVIKRHLRFIQLMNILLRKEDDNK